MSARIHNRFERKLERERRAREEAERLLEEKSNELYWSNKALEDSNTNIETYLRAIHRFALALTTIESEEKLIWHVAREVVAQLGFDDCVFYIFEPEQNVIVQRAAIEAKNPRGEEILNPLRIPLGEGITGTVAKTRIAEIVGDVSKDPRYIDDIVEGGSEIAVPVEHDGQLFGVLDSENPNKNFYTPLHLEVLQTVAAYAAAKIAERRAHNLEVQRGEDLEEKVALLTALKDELEIAKEKAEETSALKSRFVATISHEIRTPLAGMLGSLDLLQDEDLGGRAAGLLDMAKNSGIALQTLLNDVIDFARSEAGTLQYEPTAFSITDLIGSVQSVWQPHLEAKGFEFGIKLADSFEASYWGDPARIRQILNNFMSNAVKYAGGGSLTLSLVRQDKAVLFSLEDCGPGIAQKDQENLFNEFTRVGASKRQIGEGAGLGLAICRQVADLMNGEVGVESDGANGSTFWLSVPLRAVDAAETQAKPKQIDFASFREKFGRRPRILVAEDVPTNQTIIRMTLEAFECRVTVVSNGVEAVEAACRHEYDLIFMDIAMPEMDGIAATKRILELKGREETPPVYALTAHGMDEDREEFEAAGMSGIVTKPFERQDLYVTIEMNMHRSLGESVHNNMQEELLGPDDFDQDMVSALLDSIDPASRAFLLQQCIADIEAGLQQLHEGIDQKDAAKAAAAAHRLKSVTGTFGLKKIQHLSGEVNDLFRIGKEQESMQQASSLKILLPGGIQALKSLMADLEGGS